MTYTIEFGCIGLTQACYDTRHGDCRGVCSPPALCRCHCHPSTREKMDIKVNRIHPTQYYRYADALADWISKGNQVTHG